jgi:CheY-like chemotaxis protein
METLRKSRILLVDDEEVVLRVIGELLGYVGHYVEAKSNGKEALATFVGDPLGFDLVITDHFMPEMEGLELAGEILKSKPRTPIIILTGGDTAIEAEAEAAGIRWFVQKPVAMDKLMDVINQALRG